MRGRLSLRGFFGASLLAFLTIPSHGCKSNETPTGPPRKDCASTIWARASAGGSPRVLASWASWGLVDTAPYRDGWHVLRPTLPAGEYGYLLEDTGRTRLDPENPLTTFKDGVEVSLLVVDDCHIPATRIDRVTSDAAGTVTIDATFVATATGEALVPEAIRTESPSARFEVVSQDDATGRFTLVSHGLPRGKHTVTVVANDLAGRRAPPQTASAWVLPAAATWNDAVLYQIVIDRYRTEDGAPPAEPKTPASRAGGTLGGVLAELSRGVFEEMGVTALWLSPVYQNPLEARMGPDGHVADGYHGYWPIEPRRVEPRLGGDAALRAVIAAAHRRGIRVLLDIVPNHVYEASPRYQQHQGDGWFNDGAQRCVCGSPGCDWSDHILSCWFANFLPDVRWENASALKTGVEDTVFWARSFDADGVRIDAVPMMPRAATRRMAAALRASSAPRESSFVLGEVFTGPGGGDTIRFHLGPDGLDSAFDFPLMWALRDAIARGSGDFAAIEAQLTYEETALVGSGAVLARILGNHDTTRFLSVANGDDTRDPWTQPAAQPVAGDAFARLTMGMALVFSLSGMPVVYYGDELGLAGGSDPDSRRVFPKAPLSPASAAVRDATARLGRLRGCSASLRQGTRSRLLVANHAYAFSRSAPGDSPVVTVLSTSTSATSVALGAAPGGVYRDVLSGDTVTLPGSVSMPRLSARVLVPVSSPCL